MCKNILIRIAIDVYDSCSSCCTKLFFAGNVKEWRVMEPRTQLGNLSDASRVPFAHQRTVAVLQNYPNNDATSMPLREARIKAVGDRKLVYTRMLICIFKYYSPFSRLQSVLSHHLPGRFRVFQDSMPAIIVVPNVSHWHIICGIYIYIYSNLRGSKKS